MLGMLAGYHAFGLLGIRAKHQIAVGGFGQTPEQNEIIGAHRRRDGDGEPGVLFRDWNSPPADGDQTRQPDDDGDDRRAPEHHAKSGFATKLSPSSGV